MINTITPVAIVTYRRADLLEKLLDSLKANDVKLLYIFSDAPAHSSVEREVDEVRKIIQKKANWCDTSVTERTTNLGMGKSVINSISSVLNEHESVMMFEDDLICVPGTYQYLTSALKQYWFDNRVMSVTAWNHPSITPEDINLSPYFDGKAECWGIGTWRRVWNEMKYSAIELMEKCKNEGVDINRYGSDMTIMALEAEERNRWAVTFWLLHLLYGGLCLRPPYSMVEHLGWDTRATTSNASPEMLAWCNPPLKEHPPIPIHWPLPEEHPDCADLWRKAIGY